MESTEHACPECGSTVPDWRHFRGCSHDSECSDPAPISEQSTEGCNDWCGPGSHHMPPCPTTPFEPPAEAQQDDEVERVAAALAEAADDGCFRRSMFTEDEWADGAGEEDREWHRKLARVALGAARPSADTETLREAIRDVLAGWPIGSGYYADKVGTGDAGEMADAVLADPVVRAALHGDR